MKKREVPFYENPDNTHCYQAVLRSVLKYFMPDKEYSWEDLDKLTEKEEGYWTWSNRGILNLKKMGFDIVAISSWDPVRLAKDGEKYMIEKHGEKIARISLEHTKDLNKERKTSQELADADIHKNGLPDFTDLEKLIDKGYLIMCHVNGRKLHDKDGYSGHFVLVFGYDKQNFILHDPGPNGGGNKKVPYDFFLKAWGKYSKEDTRNLTAFKLG